MPRQHSRLFRSLVGLVFAASAAGLVGAQALPAAVLTVAHINDVYEIDTVEGGASGGLSRVATVVGRLRSAGPLMVTLGGDFLSPSAIGGARVDGEALAGRQMVDVLDAAGVQWATLGNHEFDISEAAFRARMTQAKFSVVVSNVTDAAGRMFERTVTSAVVPVRTGGRVLRIGLFGLAIDANRKPWVRFSDPMAAARAQVDAFRGRTDAIIALTHLTLVTDQDLAEALPEIDLILGGHEHENWLLRRGAHHTPIIKADSNARSVAVVTMRFGARGTRPVVTSRLQPIDTTVPKQPKTEGLIRRWVTAAFDAFRREGLAPERVVATVPERLDGRESVVRNRSSALTDLILSAFSREAGNPDVTIVNGGSIRIDDVLPAGPVTEFDTLRVFPSAGRLLKAVFDGALLATVLDIGSGNGGTGGFMHFRGATREPGGWAVQGRPIDPTARYSVALPEYELGGTEYRFGFLTRTNPQVHDVQTLRDMRLVLVDELRARAGALVRP